MRWWSSHPSGYLAAMKLHCLACEAICISTVRAWDILRYRTVLNKLFLNADDVGEVGEVREVGSARRVVS
jgi:hypothetical protein